MNTRSAPLDFLRTVAVFLVFGDHFKSFATDFYFGRLGQFGFIGVDLFFVLSGFLIASQLFKYWSAHQTLSLKDFYIRRGLRIWPNFFTVLLIYILLPGFSERSILAPLWKFFTFTQNFNLDFGAHGAFSHAWSLCVEEQFYLFLPFLLLLLFRFGTFRRALVLLTFVVIAGVFIRSISWNTQISPYYHAATQKGLLRNYYRVIYYPTYCRLDGLALGVSIAALRHFKLGLFEGIGRRFANHFLVGGIICIEAAYFFFFFDPYGWAASTVGYPLIDFGFAAVVLAAIYPESYFSRLNLNWAKHTANLSFAFYLTHKAMIHHCKKWLSLLGLDPGSILYPLIILMVCVAVSMVLYTLVEKPFLKLRDRWLHVQSLHFSVRTQEV